MVSGPSRQLRLHAPKAKLPEIKLIDKEVDHPHRIVLGNIVFKLRRKHRSLSAIRPAYKARHQFPPPLGVEILRQNHYFEKSDFSHSLGRKLPSGLLAATSLVCGRAGIVAPRLIRAIASFLCRATRAKKASATFSPVEFCFVCMGRGKSGGCRYPILISPGRRGT
jgi:hypothetical protein